MHLDSLLPTIVAVLVGVLAIGLVLRRFHQPHVVAYLLAGIVLGPAVLDVFPDEQPLIYLGDFGVVLLLFFVGMEVSIPHLARGWRVAVFGTLLQILASVGCVAAVGVWLDWPWARTVLVGFAISLSSTAVVLSLLRARGEMDTPRGRDAVGILLAQDLALIPMLIVLGFLVGDTPPASVLVRQGVGGVAIVAVIVAAARRPGFRMPFGAIMRSDHEYQVFAAFLLCFGLAFLSALAHLSTALGAFVAGVIVAASRETRWVHDSLEPFRVIFVALFFVSVGLLLDPGLLAERWGIIAFLVLATLATNTLINAVVLRMLGRSWAASLAVGATLAQIGEFSFVLAAVGLSTGIISEYGYQVILAVIATTLLLSPAWIALVGRVVGVPGHAVAVAEAPSGGP